jgi:hypothetical protein
VRSPPRRRRIAYNSSVRAADDVCHPYIVLGSLTLPSRSVRPEIILPKLIMAVYSGRLRSVLNELPLGMVRVQTDASELSDAGCVRSARVFPIQETLVPQPRWAANQRC